MDHFASSTRCLYYASSFETSDDYNWTKNTRNHENTVNQSADTRYANRNVNQRTQGQILRDSFAKFTHRTHKYHVPTPSFFRTSYRKVSLYTENRMFKFGHNKCIVNFHDSERSQQMWSFTYSQMSPEKHTHSRAEKTTYCRPKRKRFNDEYFIKMLDDKLKLQELVKRLAEARKREKKISIWRSYIKHLKIKHGIISKHSKISKMERYTQHVPLPTFDDDDNGNRFDHLLREIYYNDSKMVVSGASTNTSKNVATSSEDDIKRYITSMKSSQKNSRSRTPVSVCYPTASQALMIKRMESSKADRGANLSRLRGKNQNNNKNLYNGKLLYRRSFEIQSADSSEYMNLVDQSEEQSLSIENVTVNTREPRKNVIRVPLEPEKKSKTLKKYCDKLCGSDKCISQCFKETSKEKEQSKETKESKENKDKHVSSEVQTDKRGMQSKQSSAIDILTIADAKKKLKEGSSIGKMKSNQQVLENINEKLGLLVKVVLSLSGKSKSDVDNDVVKKESSAVKSIRPTDSNSVPKIVSKQLKQPSSVSSNPEKLKKERLTQNVDKLNENQPTKVASEISNKPTIVKTSVSDKPTIVASNISNKPTRVASNISNKQTKVPSNVSNKSTRIASNASNKPTKVVSDVTIKPEKTVNSNPEKSLSNNITKEGAVTNVLKKNSPKSSSDDELKLKKDKEPEIVKRTSVNDDKELSDKTNADSEKKDDKTDKNNESENLKEKDYKEIQQLSEKPDVDTVTMLNIDKDKEPEHFKDKIEKEHLQLQENPDSDSATKRETDRKTKPENLTNKTDKEYIQLSEKTDDDSATKRKSDRNEEPEDLKNKKDSDTKQLSDKTESDNSTKQRISELNSLLKQLRKRIDDLHKIETKILSDYDESNTDEECCYVHSSSIYSCENEPPCCEVKSDEDDSKNQDEKKRKELIKTITEKVDELASISDNKQDTQSDLPDKLCKEIKTMLQEWYEMTDDNNHNKPRKLSTTPTTENADRNGLTRSSKQDPLNTKEQRHSSMLADSNRPININKKKSCKGYCELKRQKTSSNEQPSGNERKSKEFDEPNLSRNINKNYHCKDYCHQQRTKNLIKKKNEQALKDQLESKEVINSFQNRVSEMESRAEAFRDNRLLEVMDKSNYPSQTRKELLKSALEWEQKQQNKQDIEESDDNYYKKRYRLFLGSEPQDSTHEKPRKITSDDLSNEMEPCSCKSTELPKSNYPQDTNETKDNNDNNLSTRDTKSGTEPDSKAAYLKTQTGPDNKVTQLKSENEEADNFSLPLNQPLKNYAISCDNMDMDADTKPYYSEKEMVSQPGYDGSYIRQVLGDDTRANELRIKPERPQFFNGRHNPEHDSRNKPAGSQNSNEKSSPEHDFRNKPAGPQYFNDKRNPEYESRKKPIGIQYPDERQSPEYDSRNELAGPRYLNEKENPEREFRNILPGSQFPYDKRNPEYDSREKHTGPQSINEIKKPENELINKPEKSQFIQPEPEHRNKTLKTLTSPKTKEYDLNKPSVIKFLDTKSYSQPSKNTIPSDSISSVKKPNDIEPLLIKDNFLRPEGFKDISAKPSRKSISIDSKKKSTDKVPSWLRCWKKKKDPKDDETFCALLIKKSFSPPNKMDYHSLLHSKINQILNDGNCHKYMEVIKADKDNTEPAETYKLRQPVGKANTYKKHQREVPVSVGGKVAKERRKWNPKDITKKIT